MALAGKTPTQIKTAFETASKLAVMLRQFDDGSAKDSTKAGRFTVAEIEAGITAAKAAIDIINAA